MVLDTICASVSVVPATPCPLICFKVGLGAVFFLLFPFVFYSSLGVRKLPSKLREGVVEVKGGSLTGHAARAWQNHNTVRETPTLWKQR